MIVQTITNDYEFYEWLKESGSYKDNFSVEGAKALQSYIEELSEDIGESVEFDPIAWCVEWTEWESLKEFNKEQGTEYQTWEEVQDETHVIELDNGGAVVQDF